MTECEVRWCFHPQMIMLRLLSPKENFWELKLGAELHIAYLLWLTCRRITHQISNTCGLICGAMLLFCRLKQVATTFRLFADVQTKQNCSLHFACQWTNPIFFGKRKRDVKAWSVIWLLRPLILSERYELWVCGRRKKSRGIAFLSGGNVGHKWYLTQSYTLTAPQQRRVASRN